MKTIVGETVFSQRIVLKHEDIVNRNFTLWTMQNSVVALNLKQLCNRCEHTALNEISEFYAVGSRKR